MVYEGGPKAGMYPGAGLAPQDITIYYVINLNFLMLSHRRLAIKTSSASQGVVESPDPWCKPG